MVTDMDKRNNKVVLSLGGNIGDVKQTLTDSIKLLEQYVGKVSEKSPLYRTKAWGVESQPDFLNQALVLFSRLSPEELLVACLDIESKLGRVRKQKWYERTIDIDILFYNDEIIDTSNLIIPHQYIHERNFVLYPLVDLLPDYKHPLIGLSMKELKKECKDELQVVRC
jgi:2-amino-4-hydroxy-6-hydroxymethyldihydropteridine diphosphokinase